MIALAKRDILRGVAAFAALRILPSAHAQGLPPLHVSKSPTCGCCAGWVDHIRGAGFQARVTEMADLTALKARLQVPSALASCHTAEIDGYVIEGHVPADAIKRLLLERPKAKGLAVPGMPTGSPGMEAPGAKNEPYDVILFGPTGQRPFARYVGSKRA